MPRLTIQDDQCRVLWHPDRFEAVHGAIRRACEPWRIVSHLLDHAPQPVAGLPGVDLVAAAVPGGGIARVKFSRRLSDAELSAVTITATRWPDGFTRLQAHFSEDDAMHGTTTRAAAPARQGLRLAIEKATTGQQGESFWIPFDRPEEPLLLALRRTSLAAGLPFVSAPLDVTLLAPGQAPAAWVPQSGEVPMPDAAIFNATPPDLPGHRVAGVVVVPRGLRRAQLAEQVVRDALARELGAVLDATLLDAEAATAARPAGLHHGLTPVAAGDDLVGAVLAAVAAALEFCGPQDVAIVGGPVALAALVKALPSAAEGWVMGVRVHLSPHAKAGLLSVIAGGGVAAGFEGVELSVSDQAMLSGPGGPVALWSSHQRGLLAELRVSWRVIPGAVSAIQV